MQSLERLLIVSKLLEQCNLWPHVGTRHHNAQLARVCRPFKARQSRDAPIGLLR